MTKSHALFEPCVVLTAVKAAARRLRRWPSASLDRGCARRFEQRRHASRKHHQRHGRALLHNLTDTTQVPPVIR